MKVGRAVIHEARVNRKAGLGGTSRRPGQTALPSSGCSRLKRPGLCGSGERRFEGSWRDMHLLG